MIIPFSLSLLIFSTATFGLAAAQSPAERPDSSEGDALSPEPEELRRYGRHGSMRTRPGQRDAVESILLSVADGLSSAGCLIYVVSRDPDDADLVWVTEVWESREAHGASLKLPAVREAIEKAMPLLTGEFTGSEFTVRGGLGLP